MPVTRSRGQAERWESEVRVGALANPLPASRHTDVPDLSAGTQEEAITGVNPTMFDREEEQPAGPKEGPLAPKLSSSKNTSKSRRKARDARREILRLKLELAELALEDAESDSSDSEVDIKSKTEYVRSWVETNAVIQEPSAQCADSHRKSHPIPSIPRVPPCPIIVTHSENWLPKQISPVHEIEKLKEEVKYLKDIISQRIESVPLASQHVKSVRVLGPAGIPTYALLDDGSTVSLMDEALAEAVGAEGHLDPLKIEAIGGTVIDTPGSKRVTVTLANSSNKKVIFRARTTPHLNLSPQTVSEKDLSDCKHLTELKNHLVYSSAKPKIVIGQDNWNLLLAEDVRSGLDSQPVVSLTTLGWVLHGAHSRVSSQEVHFANQLTTESFASKSPFRYPRRRNRRERTRKSLPESLHRREPHSKGSIYEKSEPVFIAMTQLSYNTRRRKRIKIVNTGVDEGKKIVHTRDDPLEGPTERLVPLPKRNDAVAHRGKDAAPRRDMILHGGRNVRDGASSLVVNSRSATCAT